jgi:hypothetical protein
MLNFLAKHQQAPVLARPRIPVTVVEPPRTLVVGGDLQRQPTAAEPSDSIFHLGHHRGPETSVATFGSDHEMV